MSARRENRAELAATILAAPDDHSLVLDLYDGETAIEAAPEDDHVFIAISTKLGLHATMKPDVALRLGTTLIWAALQVGAGRPVCHRCNDTHQVLIDGAPMACGDCPDPCVDCSAVGGGWCAVTPCPCSCHHVAGEEVPS